MEIKIRIYLDEESKLVLGTNLGFKHIFNQKNINANDIYKMLSYETGNTYVLEPLQIDESENSSEYKIAKPLYDLIEQITNEVKALNLDDSKVLTLELDESAPL